MISYFDYVYIKIKVRYHKFILSEKFQKSLVLSAQFVHLIQKKNVLVNWLIGLFFNKKNNKCVIDTLITYLLL